MSERYLELKIEYVVNKSLYERKIINKYLYEEVMKKIDKLLFEERGKFIDPI